MLRLPRRHLLALLLATLPFAALAAPPKGGAANLAMIGEPQSLDPMASWWAPSCSTSTKRCMRLTANGMLCQCWPMVCPAYLPTV